MDLYVLRSPDPHSSWYTHVTVYQFVMFFSNIFIKAFHDARIWARRIRCYSQRSADFNTSTVSNFLMVHYFPNEPYVGHNMGVTVVKKITVEREFVKIVVWNELFGTVPSTIEMSSGWHQIVWVPKRPSH